MQCKFTLNNLALGVMTMNYQWAILTVFITFALLEAKSGRLFKKTTEVTRTEVNNSSKTAVKNVRHSFGKLVL